MVLLYLGYIIFIKMKLSNVGKDLVVSYVTFDGMVNALMILNQLMNGAMANFSNPTMNTRMGARRSLTFFHRHFWITVLIFLMALMKRQIKLPGKEDLHFILIAGTLNVFLNMQLNSKNFGTFTVPFTVLFQPMFPVFVLIGLIALRLDTVL